MVTAEEFKRRREIIENGAQNEPSSLLAKREPLKPEQKIELADEAVKQVNEKKKKKLSKLSFLEDDADDKGGEV